MRPSPRVEPGLRRDRFFSTFFLPCPITRVIHTAFTSVIVTQPPMKTVPKISETEWEVMKVLWAQSPLSAGEIIAQLSAQDEWHPKTAKTLLNRLVRKKALGFEQEGRAYLYRPLVREVDCVRHVSDSFLDRVFGGSLTPMLAHFVERRKMSAEQVRELKRLLNRKD